MTGVVMSQFSWDLTLERIFRDAYTHGLYAILESEGVHFTYEVHDGFVEFM